jgi:adenosine/AMP kinase
VEEKFDLRLVPVTIPDGANIIIGQTHFIKTVEDVYEIVVTTAPQARFALAFNEASGACLVRTEANDDDLRAAAVETAMAIGAGHIFVLVLRNAYPINVLGPIKNCPEVCHVYCATANPLQVIVVQSPQGRGILGVIDGAAPVNIEQEADRQWRKGLLRKIGYKL